MTNAVGVASTIISNRHQTSQMTQEENFPIRSTLPIIWLLSIPHFPDPGGLESEARALRALGKCYLDDGGGACSHQAHRPTRIKEELRCLHEQPDRSLTREGEKRKERGQAELGRAQ